MDRYTFLLLINLPFIVFGILRAFAMFRESVIAILGLISRLIFWLAITFCLGFSRYLYVSLYSRGLVGSRVISLTTVALTTGIIFSFFLIIRAYSKMDAIEKLQAEMLTRISIINAEQINKG
jgi:hypothetical protein